MSNFFSHISWFFSSDCPSRQNYENLTQQLKKSEEEKEKFRVLGQKYYEKVQNLTQQLKKLEEEKEKFRKLGRQYYEEVQNLTQQLKKSEEEKEKYRVLSDKYYSDFTQQLNTVKTEKQKYYEENQEITQQLKKLEKETEEYRKLNDKYCNDLTQQLNATKTENQKYYEENQRLARWEHIIDAEEKAREIIDFAQKQSHKTLQQIEEQIQQANTQANQIIDKAKYESDFIKKEAQRASEVAADIINQANKNAKTIIDDAQTKADSILADIKPEAERLTRIAEAMRHRIEGYGTEYMIPGIGLLDELAVNFGYTEGGQKLKEARAKVKTVFKEGRAAYCDYVQENRRETAVAFVADAFNGKIEEILSRVRHNNYGQLMQEIREAEILVNKNGEAFRNARILPEYVEARLQELKWATVVHELKLKEREEQKVIRERIREEEKVRKEIEKAKKEAEKAQKEAEKEQELAQKIYNELKQKFDTMSEAEKQQHASEMQEAQQRIQESQQRLQEAEEKGQRAMSMAQQTKAGHVYVISNIGSFGENVYKIGMTRRLDPTERVYELGDASVPFPFDIHGMIHFEDAPTAELQLHRIFVMGQLNKVNNRKEFFRAKIEEIKTAVEKLGGEAQWTMVAEASQYRETLIIEDRITNDKAYRRQWEERQILLEEMDSDVSNDELN